MFEQWFSFQIEKMGRKKIIVLTSKFFGIQFQILNVVPWKIRLSQAAACDGIIYSVNYNGQNSGTQGYALPLFED